MRRASRWPPDRRSSAASASLFTWARRDLWKLGEKRRGPLRRGFLLSEAGAERTLSGDFSANWGALDLEALEYRTVPEDADGCTTLPEAWPKGRTYTPSFLRTPVCVMLPSKHGLGRQFLTLPTSSPARRVLLLLVYFRCCQYKQHLALLAPLQSQYCNHDDHHHHHHHFCYSNRFCYCCFYCYCNTYCCCCHWEGYKKQSQTKHSGRCSDHDASELSTSTSITQNPKSANPKTPKA